VPESSRLHERHPANRRRRAQGVRRRRHGRQFGGDGPETDLKAALARSATALRRTATLLDWLLCPAFAWLITRLLPDRSALCHRLLLIGLAPAAPRSCR
jgi:hypothetical protein